LALAQFSCGINGYDKQHKTQFDSYTTQPNVG